MIRRWCLPLTTIALVLGSLMAAGSASASATTHTRAAAAHAYNPGGLMTRPSPAAARASGHRFGDTSTNWSGYAVTGGTGAFTSVSASWREPTGTCSGSAKYSSFWVGLDGFNSNSVEQTGTDVDCSGRTPVYYGWYEMYPAFPVNFSNTVRPGDSFSASVTFSGTQTYTLVLSDITQGWTKTENINQSGLSRSSAEVITEAPSSSRGVLPLANFGTVSYSTSAANGSSLGTQNPDPITMVNNSGQPKDSTSGISSGGAFSNTWIRSN
jgi:Peptidase A4 family